jgi:hypothetical protein
MVEMGHLRQIRITLDRLQIMKQSLPEEREVLVAEHWPDK